MHRIILLLAVLSAAGCAGYETGFLRYGDAPMAARPTDANVEVYRRAPRRAHRELGEVFAVGRSIEDLEGVRAALVRQAAAVGADAVIFVQVAPGLEEYGYYGGYRAYGPYYHHGWGWGGFPDYYHGVRSIVVLRGVAVAWTGPAPAEGGPMPEAPVRDALMPDALTPDAPTAETPTAETPVRDSRAPAPAGRTPTGSPAGR